MRCFGLFKILFAIMATVVMAMPSELSTVPDVLDGFSVSPLTWTGPIDETDQEYTFSGTAKIIDQILEINPDYAVVSTDVPSNVTDNLTFGDETDKVDVNCNPSKDWHAAKVSQIRKEAGYLQSLGDRPCNAAANECVRVSCSYNTAVYFCNIRKYDWGPSCKYVGEIVYAVGDMCSIMEDNKLKAKGLVTDPGNFYIWVGKASPGC